MFEIKGKYACAKVFTDVLEPSAEGQIKAMCDQPFVEGSKIRIMPDVGKAVLSGVVLQIFLLVLNRVALSGCFVISRKPLIQSCNAGFSFGLNHGFTSFPCAVQSCPRFLKVPGT